MSWRRGLTRIWLVISIGWLAVSAVVIGLGYGDRLDLESFPRSVLLGDRVLLGDPPVAVLAGGLCRSLAPRKVTDFEQLSLQAQVRVFGCQSLVDAIGLPVRPTAIFLMDAVLLFAIMGAAPPLGILVIVIGIGMAIRWVARGFKGQT